MGKAIFITATDTGCGKTIATGCLAAALSKQGKVCVYKPIQCGDLLEGEITSPDLAQIHELSGVDVFNDYCFTLAASPHLADEKGEIDVAVIKKRVDSLVSSYDYVLVEGAGGLIVPLNPSYTMLDLIKELSIPAVVVSRAGLGTINHTSLSLRALAGVSVLGVIFNYYKGGIVEEDNKRIVAQINDIAVLGALPLVDDVKELIPHVEEYVDMSKIID